MEPQLGGGLRRIAGTRLLRSQSDRRLVELTRAGHEEAFEAIVARYRRPLLRYCARFLSADQAEDTVQEALARAYTALLRNAGDIELRPWLYRVAHNASVSALRQARPREEALGDGRGWGRAESPGDALERSERLRHTVASVNALPEQQRSAILLSALEGRSYDEIAAELGTTRGAAHQLVHRARSKLRAAAVSIIPPSVASRLPWASLNRHATGRSAELGAAAGTTGLAVKVCAAVLVTGAVVSGAVHGPVVGGDDAGRPPSDRPDHGQALHASVAPGPQFVARAEGDEAERTEDAGVDDGRSADASEHHRSDRGAGGSGSSGPGGGDPAQSAGDDTGGGSGSSGPGGGDPAQSAGDDTGGDRATADESATSGSHGGGSGSSGDDGSRDSGSGDRSGSSGSGDGSASADGSGSSGSSGAGSGGDSGSSGSGDGSASADGSGSSGSGGSGGGSVSGRGSGGSNDDFLSEGAAAG